MSLEFNCNECAKHQHLSRSLSIESFFFFLFLLLFSCLCKQRLSLSPSVSLPLLVPLYEERHLFSMLKKEGFSSGGGEKKFMLPQSSPFNFRSFRRKKKTVGEGLLSLSCCCCVWETAECFRTGGKQIDAPGIFMASSIEEAPRSLCGRSEGGLEILHGCSRYT